MSNFNLADLHNIDLKQIDMDSLDEMLDMEENVGVRKFREERYEPKRQTKQQTLANKKARAAKREEF